LNYNNDIDQIDRVASLLERQFKDDRGEIDKWDIFCKGIEDYDQYIKNLYKYLDVKGFSPKINNTQVKLELDSIYVPLKLGKHGEGITKSDELDLDLNIESALKKLNKLVVLGDPGSGKSTVLKYIAHKVCNFRATESYLGDLVPCLIKGSEYAKYVFQSSKGLSEYIVDHIDKKYELLFAEKLEKNQLLVLIDGIDEISIVSLRHNVIEKINAFVAQYPKSNIVVSSRLVGYNETRLNGYFSHLYVKKFTDKQIKEFVYNWHKSVANTDDIDNRDVNENANILFETIKKNSSVFNLATNPLLITIIALIHYQGSSLPEKRAALYDVATSTFLENWVRQRDNKNVINFDKDSLVEMLSPISFFIHNTYSEGLIEESVLKQKLATEYKKIYPHATQKEERQELRDLIDFLREDAGFLFEKGVEENGEALFGFVHQTFLEYFTAIEFKTRWKEGSLKSNLQEFVFNANWVEVIKLAASLFKLSEQTRLGRQYATEFVQDIINIKEIVPGSYKPLKTAVSILGDDTEINYSLFEDVIEIVFSDAILGTYQSDNDNESAHPGAFFLVSIDRIIKTKFYQIHLLKKINEKLSSNNTPFLLKKNLIRVMMSNSEYERVSSALFEILKSNNHVLKHIMFDYNIVMPVSDIIKRVEYKQELIEFINSKDFSSNYSGHLPTQYIFCFNSIMDLINNREHICDPKYFEKNLLPAISIIKNENIREDYINSYLSIGIGTIDEAKSYLDRLMVHYPDKKFKFIEDHIEYMEVAKSHDLPITETFSLDSIKFYYTDNSKLAFIIGGVYYCFDENSIEEISGVLPQSIFDKYLDIFDLFYLFFNSKKKGVNIDDKKSLILYTKYMKHISWNSRQLNNVIIQKAFDYLYDKDTGMIDVNILEWLKKNKHMIKNSYIRDETVDYINQRVDLSSLPIYDKLFLLSSIGKLERSKLLIPQVLEDYRKEVDEDVKRDILYFINTTLD
jgi:GTPase SAR1 family protein